MKIHHVIFVMCIIAIFTKPNWGMEIHKEQRPLWSINTREAAEDFISKWKNLTRRKPLKAVRNALNKIDRKDRSKSDKFRQEKKSSKKHEIILTIYPEHKFSVKGISSYKPFALAHLEGRTEFKDNVRLFLTKKENKKANFYEFNRVIINEKIYKKPSELEHDLERGIQHTYPLHFHRKFLRPYNRLTIRVKNYYDNKAREIIIDDHVKMRILKYLTNDLMSLEKCCITFFIEVFFDKKIARKSEKYSPSSNSSNSILNQIEILNDESMLAIGDWVVLVAVTKVQGFAFITLLHYAFKVTNDLFLSQLGNGNPLMLISMESMLELWEATNFAKIKLNAECETFKKWGLSSIQLRRHLKIEILRF